MHIKGFPVEKKTTTKKTTILNEAAAKIKIKLIKEINFFAHKRSFTAIKKDFSDRQVFTVICNNRW